MNPPLSPRLARGEPVEGLRKVRVALQRPAAAHDHLMQIDARIEGAHVRDEVLRHLGNPQRPGQLDLRNGDATLLQQA